MTRTQCELQDWLITRLLIDNSGRRGIASGIKVIEFKAAVIYLGTEDLACYRILVCASNATRKIILLPWLRTRHKLKPGITMCMKKLDKLI